MVVIPTVLLAVWFAAVVLCGGDLAPGPDYARSVFMNLIGPLLVVSLGYLIYQITLTADAIRFPEPDPARKLLCCLCAWFLWYGVYIAKIILFVRETGRRPTKKAPDDQ